jgi:tripartite-type tricarboxylate transporter receptor subunit TctC
VKQGRMQALAVTSRQRSSRLPNVPTLAETVAPGFDVIGWFGVLAPAATPAPLIERLNRELNAALEAPEVAGRITDLGLEHMGGTAESFAALVRSETERWGGLIRELGLKPE